MTDYETVLVDVSDGLATVTLNRPAQKNAMSPQLHRDMYDVLTDLEYRDDFSVLIITGAGDSFCAGQDLKQYFYEMRDAPAEKERLQRLSHAWRHEILYHYRKPTVAAVNGHCFGGAFTILGSCDVVVTADDAKYGLSEVNFGHIPGGLVSRVLCEYLPKRQALYYSITGETFDGNRAVELGLATMAVPRADVMTEAKRIATVLAEKDQSAIRATKEAFRGVDLGRLTHDEAWHWLGAKAGELKGKQKTGGMGAIQTFVEGGGKYKPGLGVVPDSE